MSLPKIHIDFETRSKLDVRKVGSYKYAEHESTDVLCMAYCIGEGEPKLWVPSEPHDFSELFQCIDFGAEIMAHNAFFEQCIWGHICVPKYDFPPVPISQWRCSAAKAASYAMPRDLGKAGNALHLAVVKDESAKRTMLKLSKPRKPTKKDKSEWHSKAEDFQILYNYCKQDVEAERAIDHALPNLNASEQKIWEADQLINHRGIEVDLVAANAATILADYELMDINNALDILTGGKVSRVSLTAKLLDYLVEDAGFIIPNLRAGTIDDVLTREDLDFDVRMLLTLRRRGSLSSIKKYYKLIDSACRDSRVRDLLMYWGASTGRWAGKFVQMQNLPRGILNSIEELEEAVSLIKRMDSDSIKERWGSVGAVLSSCIRGMFISKEGHDLVAADYNAIETRVLFWLAGNEPGLKLFYNKEDPYLAMASAIYGRPLTKKDKAERQLGKTAILGLGYQMGATKFLATCLKQGIEITEAMAKKAVDTYRDVHKAVKQHWYDQEKAAIKAIRNKETAVKCGKVTWLRTGKFLLCKLPSGRCLAYAYPKLVEGEYGEKIEFMGMSQTSKQWVSQSTYGGKLVENITQAVARDLLANALLTVEKAGYPVVIHVHDEIVSEIPEGFGSVEEFEELLTRIPDWAKGIPVAAEGWRGKRYRK